MCRFVGDRTVVAVRGVIAEKGVEAIRRLASVNRTVRGSARTKTAGGLKDNAPQTDRLLEKPVQVIDEARKVSELGGDFDPLGRLCCARRERPPFLLQLKERHLAADIVQIVIGLNWRSFEWTGR